MGGKGGGGYDTSAMEKATNRGIDLQEKIYEEGKDLSKPWYTAGSSAVGRLSDLLGLSGGSVQSRDDIYKSLTPQYTSQTGSKSTPGSYNIKTIGTLSPDDLTAIQTYRPDLLDTAAYQKKNPYGNQYEINRVNDINSFLKNQGGMNKSGDSIDYAGLNAAADAQFAAQNANKPADFGTLGKAFSMEDYQEDPGLAFRREQGEQALNRSLAARGKTFSGEAAKAALDYNSGLASQEYGNAYNRYNTDQNNLYNMLAGVSGFGQNAANSQVQQGQQYVQGVNDLTTGLANAQTSAQIAQASKPSLFSQLLGTGAQIAGSYYGAKSDERLKDNIRELDEVDGIKRYEFTYKDDPEKTRFIGAMAQQVLDVIPDAVFIGDDGMYMVDYSQLPFDMSVVENGRS